MGESLKKSAVKGVIWSGLERFSGQLIGFIVIVIMSRLLTQADYGLVGMLMIFIDIAQTLVDSGVTQALIRKQDRSQKDCSTAFFFNISLSVLLYVVMYLVAPFIAEFYKQPQLVALTRVISLSIIINAFMMVQKALFTVSLNFKTQAKASVTAAVISGVAGITMAKFGMGVWSIVYYQLINLIVTGGLLWMFSSWRPDLLFSWDAFRYFFRFGTNLTIAGIMHTIYKDIYLASIGKFYNASALGFYTRAHQFGAFPSYNVSNILQRVTYPMLCKCQDDAQELTEKFRKILRMMSFGIFPMMIGLAVLSKPLVIVLLGEDWTYSGLLLSVLCLSMMWMPIDSLNLNLLQVKGRTDYFLKCEIWKKFFGFGLLVGTLPFGLMIICWGQVMRAIIDLIIDTYYTGKFLNMGLWKQVKDFYPSLLCSLIMAVSIYFSIQIFSPEWLRLVAGMIVGILIYGFSTKIFAPNELNEIKLLIKKKN